MADTPYQSLYRRYRPQRFSEMVGQEHVVRALRNSVREHKVGHAYLFSGPRGTGKTSAARILAKALNCANPVDGEPDGTCESCLRIQQGNSLDVHELDAASNNGVDAMRELVSRVALGTPGQWKVYIVDEVHMLSTAASNALLKTLEEPPAHVVFVLATTDPQKVLPTIRSRTQSFEFRLLSPELLGELVRQVNADAQLEVPAEALDLVVRKGRGSARDALSALDQVAAAGVSDNDIETIDEIVEALCERDSGRALVAVARAIGAGRDPQNITVEVIEHLRNGFLMLMAKGLVSLPDQAAEQVGKQARRLGTPAVVRAMETLGQALLDLREAPEPRVTLEVALVRLTRPELYTDPAALVERLERLERQSESPEAPNQPPPEVPNQPLPQNQATPAPNQNQAPPPSRNSSPAEPPAGVRPALGGVPRRSKSEGSPSTQTPPVSRPGPSLQATPGSLSPVDSTPPGPFPTREALTEAWGDTLLDRLSQRARSRFRIGRFTSVDGEVDNEKATFALPNVIHRDRCEELRMEVEAQLLQHFGRRIPLVLTVEADPSMSSMAGPVTASSGAVQDAVQQAAHEDETEIDISEVSAGEPLAIASPEERLLQAFPGAEEI